MSYNSDEAKELAENIADLIGTNFLAAARMLRHASNKAQGNASANLSPAFTTDTASKTGEARAHRAAQCRARREDRQPGSGDGARDKAR